MRGLREQNGTLSVEFRDGTAGEYDLVIGADGIRSTVRRLAFGDDASARPVGQVGWRFVTACLPEITTWSVMLGHRTAFLTSRSGTAACTATATSCRASARIGTRISAGFFPVSRSRCLSSSTRSRTETSCTARRSRRSRSTLGCTGGWAGRGRGACDLTQNGRGRRDGAGRHAGARRVPGSTGHCSRRTVGVRGPAPPANGLGPGADASPRSNSLPPDRGPKRSPARLRPKDLPIELPTFAGRGLAPVGARRPAGGRDPARARAGRRAVTAAVATQPGRCGAPGERRASGSFVKVRSG